MDAVRELPEVPRRGRVDHADSTTRTRTGRSSVGGQKREFDAVITEQHPDERVAWNSTGGETEHAGVVTFHKLSDTTTRVTVQLDWDPQGLIEKVGSLVGAGSHAVKKDLKNFKEFIESQGVETGAWRGDVPA